ncbi:MAG: prepilin peptidase [Opitutae bacterium]|nr:prepilin peptidase [Opitutae bacterium]
MLETFTYINADFPWFFAAFSLIFGAIVGSFLNVCIYRIPAERSVVFPGSTCACGKPIAWYHNIPILTWVFLRGRASCCGEKFSARYPAIELLTAVLFYASWVMHPPVVAIIGFLFIAFLICSTFIDLDHMIIPDRFSIGGMLIGVLLSILFPSLHAVEGPPVMENIESGVRSIIGALIGAGLVYWIAVLGEVVFRKPAMGEGDVKFVGFIGAFCGWQGAVFSMFGGAFIGTIILLPILLLGRIFGWKQGAPSASESGSESERSSERSSESGEDESVAFGSQVPFGPMLAVGGLVYFLGFDRYVDAYFADFVVSFFGQ